MPSLRRILVPRHRSGGPAALARYAALVATVLSLATRVAAQTPGPPDVIRGRVTNDSGRALAATVIVTRGPDRLVQQASTDSGGYYHVRFEQGTGDYLVAVSSPGYMAARRRVRRQGVEHELVANFVLAQGVQKLAATRTTADRPVRASDDVGPMQPEPGSDEAWKQGVNGQVSPTVAGDLSAIAGTMPNVTMTPGGPSILGSGPSSSLTTLNGMSTAATTVPRAAHVETRVTGATYDATRGGFSGANIDVRLAPGNRNYEERNAYLTVDPSWLQFTDPTSRELGATSGGFRASAGADGELVRDALTYNVSVDLARTVSQPVTLLDAGADALLRYGASPDSVARVVSVAGPLGLPLSGATVPRQQEHDALTWLGRFDDTRDSLRQRTLTTYLGYTTDGAVGFRALAAPSSSAERRQRTLGAQFVQDLFVGPGNRVLNETRASVSDVGTQVSPYRATPGAQLLLSSADTVAGNAFTPISLGGGAAMASDDARWTAEGANETFWNAGGRRHQFKALVWGRADGLHQTGGGNPLGTFTYNSIADLAANQPSAFSRTLSRPARSGGVWNAAAAFAHTYAPSRFFSLIYGVRLEGNGFAGAPPANPALTQALGVRTDVAPSRLHLSPRVGFSYTYNRDKRNGNMMMGTMIGSFFRNPTGVLRGGIGEFRDLLQPDVLANANAATGLPGSSAFVSCVGAAVPTPDWAQFSADPSTIPTTCAGGGGVLGEQAPSVTAIDPSYDVPRSWRGSLDWTSSFGMWLVQASALASYDLNQPGTVNANFAGVPRFTLGSEGNRPVFVSPAAIDPASGALSPAESRRSGQYGNVGVRVSDLRGRGEQLTLRLSPDLVPFHARGNLFWSLGYTLQSSQREFRGFDGAAFGDPRTREWAPSANDARHVFVLSGGVFTPRFGVGAVTMFARLQSGLPFTPIVAGDVNGDGIGGDRAFIPDPAREPDASLAAQLRTLLATGSSTARECLQAHLGEVVPRNGCRGPWTQSLNVQWSPIIRAAWARRVHANVYLENVLAGMDELVHGSAGMHGWGSASMPDPVLLVPRSFDPDSQRFRYDVNARFADTRPGRTAPLDPFRLVVDFSIDLTVNPDLQELRRAVEPIRGPSGWIRRDADSLEAFYLRQTSSIYKLLLDNSDSLFLSDPQASALRHADSVYSAQVRGIYRPLAELLAAGHGGANQAELDSVTATQKAYWKDFWEQPERADSILTPAQRSLMPMLQAMLGIPKENREHARFMFMYPVQLDDRKPTVKSGTSGTTVQSGRP